MDYRAIEDACAAAGLLARGGFHPAAGDGALAGAATLVLVGNAGPAMWRAFSEATPPGARASAGHPLDDWTRRVVGAIAGEL
ncbi:MAG: ferredoxin, partial [Rhodospirillales bacterium]